MLEKFTTLTPELYRYLVVHCTAPHPVLRELEAETEKLGPICLMQVSPEEGALLTLLVRAIGARRAVEVGTFTGYSALCIALGLPPDGKLLCCDISEEWTAIARAYWQKAGVADRIELRLGPALETLRRLPLSVPFDLAFIDADKVNYRSYYEEILCRLRPGGLILFDNVFWMGQVLDGGAVDDETRAIRELNDFLSRDARVEAVMLPVADGVTIARKR